MTSYSQGSEAAPTVIVVDANIAVRAVLPIGDSTGILELFGSWHRSGTQICAPDILVPETISVIRSAIFRRWISEEEGQIAVEDIFQLGVEVIPSDRQLCQSALSWAGRLGQSKAYDGFYLAVAERQGGELWTADQRLHNRAGQLGLTWVRGIEVG